MKKKMEKDKIPAIDVADREAVEQVEMFKRNYLIKDSEYKRLSVE
jgi:hypothetical protein